MKNWRSLLPYVSRVPVVRVAMALGVGTTVIGGYAGLGYLGGTVPFAEAMNLPAALAVMPDPLSILTARSPGERGKGAMFNIKPNKPPKPRQYAGVPPRGPRERVLGNVRERNPGPVVPAGALPLQPAGFVPDLPVPLTPDALGPLPPGGTTGFGPPGVFPTGPVGTPGVPGVPGPNPTPTPTPIIPAPAVPEPATWAMMSLGFALTGLAVRRRKRTRAPAA
ncbi:PEPxxWA-CTERM sorting domain-containing protein [Sphingomonas phyllosphaerae]|uniref:PEPxxWA-CTERM sorting domain-containing protein n=1 Tax=Sphingomonas phyllosphaerae TaxID=257003 RepID=UPI0003B6D350|nr:PEPxxWA-CTERM sorting domain-containing protein [Sphingomonas phyllosphaerae]